jgi:hypothetical protein
MRKNVALFALLLLWGILPSGVRAGTTDSLQDALFNVNGTVTEGSLAIPGLNASGFNATTGEGTLVFTFSPGAAGSYYFDAWFDNDLNVPFFNEYGAVSGTPSAGQTWEIGDPTAYYNSGLPPGGLGPGVDIVDDTALNVLSSANSLPGNASNYLDNCAAGSTCNGDASMAMGFSFSLTATQYETITLNLSQTAPGGGFYLQQIHPVDPSNTSELDLYFTGSAATSGQGGTTPEPGTLILVSTAVALLVLFRSREYRRRSAKVLRAGFRVGGPFALVLAAVFSAQLGQAQITVKTVPWVPATPSTPHTTYSICSDGTIPNYTNTPPTCTSPATLSESTIRLGATVTLPNTTDTYTGVWNFGDGSAAYNFSVSAANLINYDVSTTHQYPATACANPLGCGAGHPQATWTATLTITDTSTSKEGSATFPVIQQEDTLSARVNVAIDSGLWFVHTSMWRGTTTVNSNTVNVGGWDDYDEPCINSNNCGAYGGIDANYVQAYEVNGHLENGPATDPYSDDVARGLARMMNFLIPMAVSGPSTPVHQVSYNPAILVDRCSDGSTPNFTPNPPTCVSPATLIEYNPGATSCTSPPCNFAFDSNSNAQMLMEGNDSGYNGYQAGMFVDALVASGNPAGTAKAGATSAPGLPGVYGQTYQNVVEDLVDGILYCQYGGDYDDGAASGDDAGGGWTYNCSPTSFSYDDNSISQWNAVGLIGAERGFGVPIPSIAADTNQVWLTYSQDVNGAGAFPGIANGGSLTGAFGYDEWGYEPWGPFAVTPSGLVQMDMDGIGRTSAGNADQRWNITETFYHDNFCYNFNNSNSSYLQAYYDPLYYTYGMFSFSKAMLLYAPGGSLSPITDVEDEPAGTNPIDWYGALSPANGGTSPCDGFAQTLVSRQNTDGHWGGLNSPYEYYYNQGLFETAWALIILKGTVFVACINDLDGQGKPGTPLAKARIDLTWSPQPNAVSYNVLRSSTSGGPYTLLGNTTVTSTSDTSGLVVGKTYYYVVQPVNSGQSEICQSNQVAVVVPNGH